MNAFKSAVAVTVLLVCSGCVSAMDVVVEGQARSTIVIPDNALAVVQYAAEELQYHVCEATGAKLPIVAESDARPETGGSIYLGACRQAAQAGISLTDVSPNGFRIKLVGSDLFIVGRDNSGQPVDSRGVSVGRIAVHMGTLFGVYEFLEKQMGVRWLWPGKLGEFIPKSRDLRVSQWDQTWQPPLLHTRLRMHYGPVTKMEGWADKAVGWAFRRDQAIWMRRHRMGRSVGLDYPHAFGPSKFAEFINILPDGRRAVDPHYTHYVSMCVSDPGFWKRIVADWQESRSALHPWINCCENDTDGKCTCPRCLAWDVAAPGEVVSIEKAREAFGQGGGWQKWLGSLSDRYARFYLAVQKEAEKTDPDATVIALSYANYAKPPVKTMLNDRIIISLVPELMFPWTPEKRQAFRQQWQGWAATGARLYLRPNYTLDGHNFPIFYARKLGEDFGFAFARGMIATDFDSLTGQYATQGPNLYVLVRMQTDGDKPVDEILDEYYGGFGPAAKAVRPYFGHWQEISNAVTNDLLKELAHSALGAEPGGWTEFYRSAELIFTPAVMKKGFDLLDRAQQAARGDDRAGQRVAFLKKGLKHAELTLAAQAAHRSYQKAGDLLAYAQALDILDTYRVQVESQYVANMGYLAWAEARTWDRNVVQVIMKQKGEQLPDTWKFRWDPHNKGLKEQWFADDFVGGGWFDISVTSSWEKQAVGRQWRTEHSVDYDGFAWYRNSFVVESTTSAVRHILKFGAVDEACTIWLNGKLLLERPFPYKGDAESWQKPFDVDIAAAVRFDRPNTLAVRVEDNQGAGGIWKPVFVVARRRAEDR